jgi:hypothetical protein
MRFSFYVALSFFFALTQVPVSAQAGTVKKRGKVSCPAVIADRNQSAFFARTSNQRAFPYQCFESGRAAKRAGFKKLADLSKMSFGGWYRIPFSVYASTCEGTDTSSFTVDRFMLVAQDGSGLFGQICPDNTRYTGAKSADGFVLSRTYLVNEDPAKSVCIDGKLEITELIQFDQVNEFQVTALNWHRLKRCTNAASPYSCAIEYRGKAFREMHEFFPKVPTNINNLAMACESAQANCLKCHGGAG